MGALRKALVDLLPSDFQQLIDDEWIEDETLEFKRTLSQSSTGNTDRWLLDQSDIGNAAKRDLFAEVVAMANSYGGDVILGMIEAEEKPPRAVGINPLPKCVELASRLEHAARDLVRPQIPMLSVRGVPVDGEAGLVVFRVPRSRVAPHRLEMKGIEKECYRRVNDRSEPMTMREIQDLTFSVSRGVAQIEDRLSGIVNGFEKWVAEPPKNVLRYGYAVVATPMSADLYFEKIHGNQLLTPQSRAFKVKINENSHWREFQSTLAQYDWRPILRGTEARRDAGSGFSALSRMYCDGTIVEFNRQGIEVLVGQPEHQVGLFLYPNWLFTSVMNCFETADNFRSAVCAHSISYAIQLVVIAACPVAVRRMFGDMPDTIGTLGIGVTDFPRYQLGERESWHESLRLIWHDFYNAIGVDASQDDPRVEGW
jgi:hypothetical protein